MNDLDLYERLSDPVEGGEGMLETLKTAGFIDDAKFVGKELYDRHVAGKKPEIIGGAAAAALGGAAGYALSKRWKKGKPSLEEKHTTRMADAVEARTKDAKTFPGKSLNVTARYAREMAKVLSDHPIAGGALAAAGLAMPLGSSFGRKIVDQVGVAQREKVIQDRLAKLSSGGMSTGLRPIPKPGAALPKVMKPPAPPMPRVKVGSIEKDAISYIDQGKALIDRAGKAMAGFQARGAQRAGALGAQAVQKAAPHLNKVGPQIGAFARKVTGVPGSAGAPGIPGYSLKQRVGVPAIAGAALGGVRHIMKPKNPYTGKRDGSLLGSMAGGAALGAGAGLASKGFFEETQRNQHVADLFKGRLGTRPGAPAGVQPSMTLPPTKAS